MHLINGAFGACQRERRRRAGVMSRSPTGLAAPAANNYRSTVRRTYDRVRGQSLLSLEGEILVTEVQEWVWQAAQIYGPNRTLTLNCVSESPTD
jgi:hypothetical protein